MDDSDRRAIVMSEHNAAAAEGYHKALVKMQAEKAALEEELGRYRNGFQGSCYACETVGEKNIELREKVARLREESRWQSTDKKPEVGRVVLLMRDDPLPLVTCYHEGQFDEFFGPIRAWMYVPQETE